MAEQYCPYYFNGRAVGFDDLPRDAKKLLWEELDPFYSYCFTESDLERAIQMKDSRRERVQALYEAEIENEISNYRRRANRKRAREADGTGLLNRRRV